MSEYTFARPIGETEIVGGPFDVHQSVCPKHGRVTNVNFVYDNAPLGEYCFLCYHEFIKANVTAVTPFKKEDPA